MKLFESIIDAVLNASPAAHGVAVAVGTAAAPLLLGNGALPFFGVSITTLGMSAAGSMIAFAYGTPVKSRAKLYGYAIGGTFIGIWAVQILPGWLGWEWYDSSVMEAPIAGGAALLSRWVVPFVIESIPTLWRRLTNTPQPPADGGV